ncbi:MAG: transglutaminase domain-containing protein [Bacilli bacterium]
MKKTFGILITLGLLFCIYNYRKPIINNTVNLFVKTKEIEVPEANIYKKDDAFLYVKDTNEFEPNNKEDIKNIFYTSINSGWDKFNFSCDKEYNDCINDVNSLSNNAIKLNQLNNFVHPYNSYHHIETITNNIGEVEININKMYTSDMKLEIDIKINQIINKVIKDTMTNREKVKAIHDYIINNTKYDSKYTKTGKSNYSSNNAYGALIEGFAICGGYADAMALFLEIFDIKNYKIASNTHIWNYVKLDGKWYHLDLTWDDPVIKNSNKDRLEHTFFLITTKELEKLEKTQHTYDKTVYLEAN